MRTNAKGSSKAVIMEEVEVAMALICQGSDFILQHRIDDRRSEVAGKIGMFGGKVEFGETHGRAVMREISEETTLTPVVRDFTMIGNVEVEFGAETDKLRVKASVHRLEVPREVIIEAQEGSIVRIAGDQAHTLVDQMTPATREAFNKYIIGVQ